MPSGDTSQANCVSNCYVFKSRLQEFAQKMGLATPVYETIKEGPSHEPTFKSAVILNNVRYDSLPGFFNRKAAEQSAAEIALYALSLSGDTAASISQPVHETGLCKNLLQEYAQKMNHAIPLYDCKRDEPSGRIPMFSCTVEIGGMKYIGGAARTKKEAEIKAARTALLAIQATSYGSHLDGQSNYTVVPLKKKLPDLGTPAMEPAAALKPKRRHFKKKQLKKRNGANGRNNRRIKNTSQIQVHVGDQISTDLVNANANANACQVTSLIVSPQDANACQVTSLIVFPQDAHACQVTSLAVSPQDSNACQVTSLTVSPQETNAAFVPCSNTGNGNGNGDMSNDVKNVLELSG